jgi:hypothetical protein
VCFSPLSKSVEKYKNCFQEKSRIFKNSFKIFFFFSKKVFSRNKKLSLFMGNCCCSTDGFPGGGDYQPRRSAQYDQTSVSSLATNELRMLDRLSRASTLKGELAVESKPLALSVSRKFILLRASLSNGINDDPAQFQKEIDDAAPELRHFEKKRIRDWLDLVFEMNKNDEQHVAEATSENQNTNSSINLAVHRNEKFVDDAHKTPTNSEDMKPTAEATRNYIEPICEDEEDGNPSVISPNSKYQKQQHQGKKGRTTNQNGEDDDDDEDDPHHQQEGENPVSDARKEPTFSPQAKLEDPEEQDLPAKKSPSLGPSISQNNDGSKMGTSTFSDLEPKVSANSNDDKKQQQQQQETTLVNGQLQFHPDPNHPFSKKLVSRMFRPIPKKLKQRQTSPRNAAIQAWLTP